MSTICIRGADRVVAGDPPGSRHRYLRGADVVFCDERTLHVGPDFSGQFNVEIDAAKMPTNCIMDTVQRAIIPVPECMAVHFPKRQTRSSRAGAGG